MTKLKCNKYLAKGRSVYVEGRLQTRSYATRGRTEALRHRHRGQLYGWSSWAAAAGPARRVAAKVAEDKKKSRRKIRPIGGIIPAAATPARRKRPIPAPALPPPTTISRFEPGLRLRARSSGSVRGLPMFSLESHAGGSSARCAIGPLGAAFGPSAGRWQRDAPSVARARANKPGRESGAIDAAVPMAGKVALVSPGHGPHTAFQPATAPRELLSVVPTTARICADTAHLGGARSPRVEGHLLRHGLATHGPAAGGHCAARSGAQDSRARPSGTARTTP